MSPLRPERAPRYTHFIVADFVSKLRAEANSTRRVWAVLQFFQFTTDSRMPTAEELRAHAVMAIVEVAQGLFWWDIGVNGLSVLDAATVSTYINGPKCSRWSCGTGTHAARRPGPRRALGQLHEVR